MHRLVHWLHGVWLVLAVAAAVVLLDQWTKGLVRQNIPEYTALVPIAALGEWFQFEHVRNYGAAFGILQGQRELFIIIALAVTVAILIYVPKLPTDRWLVRVLLGLQLGGAIGNLIDRVFQLDETGRGYVTDFIKVGLPGVYYWPNFNIADSAIVVGVIGLGIYLIWEDIVQGRQARQGGEPAASGGSPEL